MGGVLYCGQRVVVPYYLSQGYNYANENGMSLAVVVPYYLSQGYNQKKTNKAFL